MKNRVRMFRAADGTLVRFAGGLAQYLDTIPRWYESVWTLKDIMGVQGKDYGFVEADPVTLKREEKK